MNSIAMQGTKKEYTEVKSEDTAEGR